MTPSSCPNRIAFLNAGGFILIPLSFNLLLDTLDSPPPLFILLEKKKHSKCSYPLMHPLLSDGPQHLLIQILL